MTKEELIATIQKTKNQSLLNDIARIVSLHTRSTTYETTEYQKKHLQEAINQVEEGSVLTDEQANNMIQKWLEE